MAETLTVPEVFEAIAAVCVYATCRLNEQPRPFRAIARVSQMGEDRIQYCYTILNRELDLHVPPVGPKQYLPQIASVVDAHRETERRARELLEAADDHLVTNCQNPRGAAAGVLYLASRQTSEFPNHGWLADAADVSAVTVRERYRDLQPAASG